MIGFFSTLGPEAGTSAVAVDILWPWDGALKGALTKGSTGVRRLRDHKKWEREGTMTARRDELCGGEIEEER